jgi:hypothetical protein
MMINANVEHGSMTNYFVNCAEELIMAVKVKQTIKE